MRDALNCSMMEDLEGPSLVFCHLPPRQSVSEFEPSRMSYYNANENLSVPFKWEAAPGMPIVNQSAEQLESRLQLRPPPFASNSPLNPFLQLSYREQQKTARNYSRPAQSYCVSSKSSGSIAVADSASFNGHHGRSQSKESPSRRSDIDWPEVSDNEFSSTREAFDEDRPASTATSTRKQWSFSSSSFSSVASMSSQTPSPVASGGGGLTADASTRDVFPLTNLVNFATAAPATAPGCGGGKSYPEGSEGESENAHDHVGGFLSCMPVFSKVRMLPSFFGTSAKQTPGALINLSKRLTPGSRNRVYRQSL